MFVSLVDKEKYPNVTQEFRFELVEETVAEETDAVKDMKASSAASTVHHELIMEYLDKDSANEKIEYLLRVENRITEEFIEVVAQSLDFVENPGSLQERYDAIINYLRTVARYEVTRLR